MGRYPGILAGAAHRCFRAWKLVRGFYKDSPMIFAIVLSTLLAIILLVVFFSLCMRRLVGSRGTVVVDLTLVWLFARLVARVLMFPGSFKLFQRNTEATFRIEMARQYAHYLRQLWTFLRHAARQSDSMLRGVSVDGVARGCAVLETLTASFHIQEHEHEVHLSKEQELFRSTAQELQRWLAFVQVSRPSTGRGPSGEQPLVEWLRQLGAGQVGTSPMTALNAAELAGNREEASRGIGRLELLLTILDELRYQKKSILGNALRFFRVPTIGSLNQLRTELQMRFNGHRCWVPVRGSHRLDAMYLPSKPGRNYEEDEMGREDAPLADQPSWEGPVLIWCNPNAAYYETMVYQTSWLNFWLNRGISVFLFNYAGYGRSTGKPSPSRIAEDGEAIVRFLRAKGISQVGVYGRSIGGVAACHLARHHPDLVQFVVADRTMSTLESTAQYMYGSWASKALKLTAMRANNTDNFWEVRAYKLLVVDPKDTMILDLASLRTAVASRVLARLLPEEKLIVDEGALRRLEEVWRFFSFVFAICESDEDFTFDSTSSSHDSNRPARQPAFAREEPRTDHRVKAGDSTCGVAVPAGSADRLVSVQWLEENAAVVRTAMAALADQVRSALDIVGENLEGGGVTLNDVFADNPSDASFALQSMLVNFQVWGTLGDQREESGLGMDTPSPGEGQPYASGITDSDMEFFLRKDADGDYMPPRASSQRLADIGRVVTPEMITVYHRRLARSRVAQLRKDFRRRLGALQSALSHAGSGSDASDQIDRLLKTCLHHLAEVESFLSTLGRFFKGVDLAPYNRTSLEEAAAHLSDSSDEKFLEANGDRAPSSAKPQPAIDHSLAGYIMHIDCGHNGLMDEVDMRQLDLHLRAAHFGNEV